MAQNPEITEFFDKMTAGPEEKPSDVESLELQYPANILIVNKSGDSSGGRDRSAKSPSGPKKRKVFQSIKAALKSACKEAATGKVKGHSIVIEGGTYIDELEIPSTAPKDFALEIYGNGPVLITFRSKNLIVSRGHKVILRNLKIDANMTCTPRKWAAVLATEGGYVDLVNVELTMKEKRDMTNLSNTNALMAVYEGTKMTLTKCTLRKCWFLFGERAEAVSISHCIIEESKVDGGAKTVDITRTQFTESYFCTRASSKVKISTCLFSRQYVAANPGTVVDVKCAVSATDGTQLHLTDTCFRYITDTAVHLINHGTTAFIGNCPVLFCGTAFYIDSNVEAKFIQNYLHCGYVLRMVRNPDGKVIFLRNEMLENRPIRMAIDQYSDEPMTDFENVELEKVNVAAAVRPSAKEMSKHTEGFKTGERFRGGRNVSEVEDSVMKGLQNMLNPNSEEFRLQKRCERCTHFEIMCNSGASDLEEYKKFKYCSACKKVCYCSVACQKADWKDHKVVCAEYQAQAKKESPTK